MTRILSYEQLLQQVNEVRRQRFTTNFFLDKEKHSVWIASGDCLTEMVGNTLFIIRLGGDFCNVFYSSTTLEQLSVDLRLFLSMHADQTMMFDVVGRNNQCLPLVEDMKRLGGKETTSLVRMTRISEPLDYIADSRIRKATEKDIPQVSHLLHAFFNAQTEQIPYDEELCSYARQEHVLLYEDHGQVAGFLIYEQNNTTLYLRYWFTRPEFRNSGVGSRLFRHFFEEGKVTKRQLLWVIRTNENAIKRYRHYGFHEENMFDYVLQFN